MRCMQHQELKAINPDFQLFKETKPKQTYSLPKKTITYYNLNIRMSFKSVDYQRSTQNVSLRIRLMYVLDIFDSQCLVLSNV